MGYQDRDYYREEDDQPRGFQLSGPRTMVMNLVLLNILVFVLDAFGPVRTWELVEKVEGKEVSIGASDNDPAVAKWEREGGKMYVATRWLSEPMSLKTDVVASPVGFAKNCWQLIAAGFVHSPLGGRLAFAHLAMNMFTLWVFGRDLEQKYGKWEFLRFYLVGLVAQGLIWAAIHQYLYPVIYRGNPAFQLPQAAYGASGVVTAVIIAYVLNFPNRKLSLLFGGATIPAWVIGLLYVGLDVLGTVNKWDHVAYEAHLAGAFFGFAYHWSGVNFGRLWPRRWAVSTEFLKPKPQLRVHDPDPEETYRDLDEQADHILEKLHREGEHSLTNKERRILEDYSRRMRQKHR